MSARMAKPIEVREVIVDLNHIPPLSQKAEGRTN
jgi:hypothetical protein